MMSNISSNNRQKIEVLYDLRGWIKDCILRIEERNDELAARKLKKIIATMENPIVIENLKDVFDDMNIPF
jgi:hypothetical protein